MDQTDAALIDEWRAAHTAPVRGWDLSELDGRLVRDHEPWSYESLARSVLEGADSALDLGTGGGEVLLDLLGALPADTIATEGWPPNLPVATANLGPHGIPVLAYDAESDHVLPFISGRFQAVLARHEAYDVREVYRVLRPGGRFLTQQVDGRDFEQTQQLFGGHTAHGHITVDNLRAEAQDAGFQVIADEEWSGTATFTDVGALVRYFAFVPCEVPGDFSVDRYAEQLLELHHSGRPLSFTQRRFCLVCVRPY